MNESIDINLLKQGDVQAFSEVVAAFKQQVFATCMGFVHNVEDAEDLAQDVFIEVYRSLQSFRGDSKLSTWIYRIAVNKSLNFIRKNKKNKLLYYFDNLLSGNKAGEVEMMHIRDSATADKALYQKELEIVLNKAINSLPENQRTAFVLAKYDDLSYQEIASIMQASLSSVESLIHRAKMNLQKKLINFKTGIF